MWDDAQWVKHHYHICSQSHTHTRHTIHVPCISYIFRYHSCNSYSMQFLSFIQFISHSIQVHKIRILPYISCNSYFTFHAIHITLSMQYIHLSFQCSSYSTFNAIHIFLLLLLYSCCIVLFFWSLFVKSYKSVSDSPVNHVIYVQTYPQFYVTRVSHIDLVKA